MAKDELYNALPDSFRLIDKEKGRLFLQRYLAGAQIHFDKITEQTARIKEIIDPRKASAKELLLSAPRVGIDEKLEQIFLLGRDEPNIRRVLMTMMKVWSELGTETGIVNSIRFFTGHESWTSGFYDETAILGESLIGETQTVGGVETALSEYLSYVRIMDNGLLDESLLVEVLKLHRAANEIFDVTLLDFYDRFMSDSSKRLWLTETGEEPEFTDGVMKAKDASIYHAIVKTHELSWFTNTWCQFRFRLPEESDLVRLYLRRPHDGSAPGYSINIEAHELGTPFLTVPGLSPTNTFRIPFRIYPNVWYTLTASIKQNLSAKPRIDVWIDHTAVVTGAYDSSAAYLSGGIAIEGVTGDPDRTIDIDNVEFSRILGRHARISRAGVTFSNNFNE